MNITFKKLLLVNTSLLLCLAAMAQKNNKLRTFSFPLMEKNWTAKTSNVEFFEHRGTDAVRSTDGNSLDISLNDFNFIAGTIEYDVELKGRGFPGIRFRADESGLNSETFYLRYFGNLSRLSRNTMQYAAVIDGINLWDITDDYQAGAALVENAWNHIKLVISENQMKVYVNDMDKVALRVPVLEGINKSGSITLNGDVIYANMEITPNAIEDLPNVIGFDPTQNDPNYLRNWQVLEPIDFPTGTDIMEQINTSPGVKINTKYYNTNASWSPIVAEHRAMVNLTQAFGGTEQDSRRLTWIKTTVSSDQAQEKLMKLGFSDEIWLFINGQPLYQDKNYYGSPGMKEPKGRCTLDNASIEIPLQEGENEILIGIANYFFGWGFIARWEDTNGLSY